jgi:hypothetical protein
MTMTVAASSVAFASPTILLGFQGNFLLGKNQFENKDFSVILAMNGGGSGYSGNGGTY